MTFSRGGDGTGWVYGSDTICVMTSAPPGPSAVPAAGKGLDGYGMQAAKAVSPTGGRSWLESGPSLLAQQGTVCHGQARPGVARFRGTMETMTTSCCCPHSWLQGAGAAGLRKPAAAVLPTPQAACTCLGLSQAETCLPLLAAPLWSPHALLSEAQNHCLQAGSPLIFGSECLPRGLFLAWGPQSSFP